MVSGPCKGIWRERNVLGLPPALNLTWLAYSPLGASHIYTETGYLTYRGEKSTPWGTYRRFRVYHNLKVDFNNVWTLMTKTLIQAAEARGYRIRWHRNGPKAAWIPTILMAFPLALTACATAPSSSPVSSTPASSTMQSSTSVTSTSNSPTAPAPEGETEVSQVLFRLSRWENLEHAQKI